MDETDILIAGAGLAGLACACAMAEGGRRVTVVDPAPAETGGAAGGEEDWRSTAFLQPARDLLEAAGVWPLLGGDPAPLAEMRALDLRTGHVAPFAAAEISDRPFGWNVLNWRMRAALLERTRALPGVEIRAGAGVRDVLARTGEAIVTLEGGARVRARLLVGADGKGSAVRRALGIAAPTLRTGQTAISFAVAHAGPHGAVSTEVYDEGGPLVLVPLPDGEAGAHRSAAVWMQRGPEAARLMALDDAAFAAAATARSGGVLGDLALAAPRMAWPVVTRMAARFAGPSTALIAEAAHAVPPIGAQGLNMSLADVAALRDVSAGDALGTEGALRAYERRRMPDVGARIAAVTMLGAAAMGGPLAAPRAAALGVLSRAPALRRGLMRAGLGG